MRIHRRKRLGISETSAASDMAFLLIIYFIVIAGFAVNKGFMVNLPARDSTRLIQKDNLLRFELDRAGRIIRDGAVLSPDQAEGMIRGGISANPNLAVMLSVAPEAAWQRVVSFVEMAQRLRVDAFSFSMDGVFYEVGVAGGGGVP